MVWFGRCGVVWFGRCGVVVVVQCDVVDCDVLMFRLFASIAAAVSTFHQRTESFHGCTQRKINLFTIDKSRNEKQKQTTKPHHNTPTEYFWSTQTPYFKTTDHPSKPPPRHHIYTNSTPHLTRFSEETRGSFRTWRSFVSTDARVAIDSRKAWFSLESFGSASSVGSWETGLSLGSWITCGEKGE